MGEVILRAVKDSGKEGIEVSEDRTHEAGTIVEAGRVSHRALLIALRDKISAEIDEGVPPRDLASLSRRLLEVSEQIDEIELTEEVDDISEAAETPDEAWTP